jgi:hypothetical protein
VKPSGYLHPYGDPLPPQKPGYMTLLLVDGPRYAYVEVAVEMLEGGAVRGVLDDVCLQLLHKVQELQT